MLSLLKEIGKTWRSVASVVLAYGIIALLFFYNTDALNQLFGFAVQGYNKSYEIAGDVSQRAAFLFGNFISPGSVFVTMMILFVRVVVLSLILWIAKGIVNLIFPSKKSEY